MDPATLLVVEDDLSFRESLADCLRGAGYQVITTREAREAMSAVEGPLQPRLIVLDLMMPGINGQQLSRMFKENARTAEVPILALSGAGPEAVLEASVDWFLSKPVEVATLLSTVRHLLGEPVEPPAELAQAPSRGGGTTSDDSTGGGSGG